MSKECSIVRDLLPLYVEDMVSADTGEFVKAHLEGCEACRTEYDKLKMPQVRDEESAQTNEKKSTDGGKITAGADVAPLVNLKRKLRKQKVQTILCTELFLVALFVSAFALLSVPAYFPYAEDLFTVKDNGDESLTITFDERVTDYLCVTDSYHCPEEGLDESQQQIQGHRPPHPEPLPWGFP